MALHGDSSVYRFSLVFVPGGGQGEVGLRPVSPSGGVKAPCSSQLGDQETRLHVAARVSIHQNGTASPTLGPQGYCIGEK